MPDDLRKTKTAEVLARADQVMKQAQSLRTDINRQMSQQRAHDQSVTQPLGPRKAAKRRN